MTSNLDSRAASRPAFLRAARAALVGLAFLAGSAFGGQEEAPAEPASSEAGAPAFEPKPFWKRVLYYLPNRVLDATDVFRLRARVGPGVAVGVRATEYADFYAGTYSSAFIGLPGPRHPEKLRPWAGQEGRTGLVFFGVDATDATDFGPGYADAEVAAEAQVAIVGASFSFDAAELLDLVYGFATIDIRRDDLDTPPAVPGVPNAWQRIRRETNAAKPARFDSWPHRFDYVRATYNEALEKGMRSVDEAFVAEGDTALAASRPSRMRFGLHAEFLDDDGFEFGLSPDIDVDLSLPNLERRWSLIVTGRDLGEFPGTLPSERDAGTRVGVQTEGRFDIDFGGGIRLRWPPVAYVEASWERDWEVGRWLLRPSAEAFYETEDGWGTVASLAAWRWLGVEQKWGLWSDTTGRIGEIRDGVEWEQGVTAGYAAKLLDRRLRGRAVSRRDLAHGWSVRYAVGGNLGSDTLQPFNYHRLQVTYRRPLYRDWVFLDVTPELEWRREFDWRTDSLLRIGFDAVFWELIDSEL